MRSRLASCGAAAFAMAALLAASGCYPGRMKYHYRNTPYAPETPQEAEDAIIEESGGDGTAVERQRLRLEQIAREDDTVYRMNSGDQIEIRVYGHDDLGMVTRLGPDGTIGMAFVGQVKLSDLTLAEGADAIREGLSEYVKNPVVSITIREVASETATISGACMKPGVYQISNSTRLADLYAQAGASGVRLFNGIDVDVADLEHSQFIRGNEILPVDFLKAINEGDPLHNIRIHKGDYIHIAQRLEASVTVCGDVNNPHKRLYEAGMGLIETLAAAGWMRNSHWKHVIIIRNGLSDPKMYKVDVDGILAGKCRNVPLHPNDIVFVPKDDMSEFNVFVQKILPTAQLVSLLRSNVSSSWSVDGGN